MRTRGIGRTRRVILLALAVVLLTALPCVSALAAQKVSIKEGTYYLKAINGNAKGQVLYWNKNASDQNTSMMFEACGGSHADYEVWYITKNRNFDDYYGIYLYKDYNGDKDRSKRIEIDNLTGRDQPYLTSTKGPHVFCGSFGNQDDAFMFVCESGNDFSTKLTIRSHDDNYTFNRHKEVKLFHHDLIYVNANKDHDTSNKLWELVPVNYVKKMKNAAPTLTANKNGNVSINWDALRKRIKSSKAWKKAKYIEIQYSTDKDFLKGVRTKQVKKGSVDQSKAKTILSRLDGKTTYYVRARLVDGNGVGTNWSKTVKIKTKGKAEIVSNEAGTTATMIVGEELCLMPTLPSEDCEPTWDSSDADIATVSQDGVVKALQPGEVTITMTDKDGRQIAFAVRINAEETNIPTLENDATLLPVEEETGAEAVVDLEMSEE